MRTILIALFAFIAINVDAQDLVSLRKTKLEVPEDYTAAKDKAEMAANHILNNPYNRSDKDRMISSQFLLKWTQQVPGFTFKFDNTAQKFLKEDNDLVAIYVASLVKHALNHPEAANNFDLLKWEAAKIFLAYCKIPKNNVQIRGEMKKALDAEADNKLPEYLELGTQPNLFMAAKATSKAGVQPLVAGNKDSTANKVDSAAKQHRKDSSYAANRKDSLNRNRKYSDSSLSNIKDTAHYISSTGNQYAKAEEEVPEEVTEVKDEMYVKFDNMDSSVTSLKCSVIDYCHKQQGSKPVITTIKVKQGVNKLNIPVSDAVLPRGNTGVVTLKDGKKTYYLVVKRN